jgi:hypothetical protein
VSLWRRPLLVGVCFGLGYGLTQRLLDLRLPGFVQWGQSFEVRQFPGTSLESLRLRVGSEVQDLRGRLDLLELDAEQPKQPEPEAEPGALELPAQPPAGDPAPVTPSRPPAADTPPAPSLPLPSLPDQP